MTTHTLYFFRRCPYAMRARMALVASKVAYVTEEVSLRNKPPELLALSPKGTVPVLQLADGRVLDKAWRSCAGLWRKTTHAAGWWLRVNAI